jgi:hypothetical protein
VNGDRGEIRRHFQWLPCPFWRHSGLALFELILVNAGHARNHWSGRANSPDTAFGEASGSDRISGYFSLSYSIGDPKGSMPCANTVFGNSPEPQIVNDPKSLYQSPSGAHGPVFTQSCNRRRSCWEI